MGKNHHQFVHKCNLKTGENNITICVKNTLTNLATMLYCCNALYNIDELKYLNTENVTTFSSMFVRCKISGIKALEKWDTSKSESFDGMFWGSELLTNIKPVKNWNVSKFKNFYQMFYRYNISDKLLHS